MSPPVELATPEALQAWVYEACGEGSRCIALLDPSRYPDAAACAEALGMDAAELDALPNLYAKYAPSLRRIGPRLWSAPVGDARWAPVFRAALESQAASFLVVPAGAGSLEQHLAGLIRMPQPDGSNLLFRFQDVVVMTALAPLLREGQHDALLGPASYWRLVDLCRNAVSIESRGSPGLPRVRRTVLRLDQSQVAALGEALVPLTIIFQANETDATLLAGLDKCGQVRLIRERMRAARRHGLVREDDIALYCVLSLQLPEGFDQDGPVAGALEDARERRVSFGEAIDDVPVERWREWDEVLDAMDKKEQAR